jgi:hypothetical protein
MRVKVSIAFNFRHLWRSGMIHQANQLQCLMGGRGVGEEVKMVLSGKVCQE